MFYLGSKCCVCMHGAGWLGVSVGAFFGAG